MTGDDEPDEPVQVSVIVPVYNDRDGLKRLLPALADQTYPETGYEILLVDNNSNEKLRDLTSEFSWIRVFEETTQGSYAARNRGLKEASGDFLAFTDADCVPGETWLEAGVEALAARERPAIVGGRIRIVPHDERDPTPVELYEMATAFDQRSYIEHGNFAVTANLFADRDVVDAIGLFNASLRSGGDSEWCRRAHDAGFGLVYAHDAVVDHPARRTMDELTGKLDRLTRGSQQKAELGLKGDDRGFALRAWDWAVDEIDEVGYILQSSELETVADRLKALGVSLSCRAFVAKRYVELRLGRTRS